MHARCCAPRRPVAAGAIKTSGENVVKLTSAWRRQYGVQHTAQGASLSSYLQGAASRVAHLELPAGAQLIPTDVPNRFNLVTTRLNFMVRGGAGSVV